MHLKENSGFIFLADLLSWPDVNFRIDAWEFAVSLAEKGIMDYKILSRMKYYFLATLYRSSYASDTISKRIALKLFDMGILNEDEIGFTLGLLMSNSFILKYNGWEYFKLLTNKVKIDYRSKSIFLRILRSKPRDILAWFIYDDMEEAIEKGLFKKSEILSLRQALKSLLMDYHLDIRHIGWSYAPKILNCGVLSLNEIKDLLPLYMDMRVRYNDEIFDYEWDECSLRSLIGSKIITEKEKNFILECISSANIGLRKYAWYSIRELVDGGIIEINDIKSKKEKFIDLFQNYSYWELYEQWKSIIFLVENGVISRADRNAFLSLLSDTDIRRKTQAWINLPHLLKHGILIREEIKERIPYFIDALTGPNYNFLDELWNILPQLINEELIDSSYGSIFLRIMKDPDFRIRKYAWENSDLLLERNILSKIDIDELPDTLKDRGDLLSIGPREMKPDSVKIRLVGVEETDGGLGDVKTIPDLVERLRDPFTYVRENAWYTTRQLIQKGKINRAHKDFILSLFSDKERRVRWDAWEQAEYLVEKGILTWSDIENIPMSSKDDNKEMYVMKLFDLSPSKLKSNAKTEILREIFNSTNTEDVDFHFAVINILIDKRKINNEDASKFLRLLSSSKFSEQDIPWLLASKLVMLYNINYKAKEAIFHLLESSNSMKIERGWMIMKLLFEFKFVGINDSRFFISILTSRNSKTRVYAWAQAGNLIDYKVLDRKSMKNIKEYFLSLLNHKKSGIRNYAWKNIQMLVDYGIIGREDSGFFISLLTGKSESSIDCWNNLWRLSDLEILSYKDVMNYDSHFFKLLMSKRSTHNYEWAVFKNLIIEGFISREDSIKYSIKFLNLLSSKNMRKRASAWELSWMIVKLGIIDRKNIEKKKDKFIEILHCKDNAAIENARSIIPILTDLKIINETEAKDLMKVQ